MSKLWCDKHWKQVSERHNETLATFTLVEDFLNSDGFQEAVGNITKSMTEAEKAQPLGVDKFNKIVSQIINQNSPLCCHLGEAFKDFAKNLEEAEVSLKRDSSSDISDKLETRAEAEGGGWSEGRANESEPEAGKMKQSNRAGFAPSYDVQ